jgi:hypothetical protein
VVGLDETSFGFIHADTVAPLAPPWKLWLPSVT